MKKIIFGIALSTILFLTGCNNNSNIVQNSNNNSTNISSTADFSNKAGYKVNFGKSFKDISYSSAVLSDNSSAQLDITFPDKSIGTLLVNPSGYTMLENQDYVTFINDIKVSIEYSSDGINLYEWKKDNYTFTYSTSLDLKDSKILENLVTDIFIN